jgi:hypothetical protein
MVGTFLVLGRAATLAPAQYQWHAAATWLLPLLLITLSLFHVPIGPVVLGGLFWILVRRATADVGAAPRQA